MGNNQQAQNGGGGGGEQAYQIDMTKDNKLGEGQFAEVYKIKRKKDGLVCAAKFFKVPLKFMDSKENLGSKRELKILKEANHPFIVQYIEDFIYKEEKLCIVTKYASRGDFETYMTQKQKFTEDEAMEFFAMILLGLEFLHSKNVFHRDLKPGNIFIDELKNGKKILKIGDFGISYVDLTASNMTESTFAKDTTPSYKSPELINQKEPTAKVDLWALGVILYELLSSKHPFKKNDYAQTLSAIILFEPEQLPNTISPSNKKIVSLLLQKDPANRPDAISLLNMQEVQHVIQKLVYQLLTCGDNHIGLEILQQNIAITGKNIEKQNTQIENPPKPQPESMPDDVQPKSPIEFQLFRNSLHVGMQNYEVLKNFKLKNANKSYEEADRYESLFMRELGYRADTIKDNYQGLSSGRLPQGNYYNFIVREVRRKEETRYQILEQIESLYLSSFEKAKNPYTVNIITYSGQGFTFDNDAIAVIPELHSSFDSNSRDPKTRLINFSGMARKLTQNANTINVFIMNMPRQPLKKEQLFKDYLSNPEESKLSQEDIELCTLLQDDALNQNQFQDLKEKGHSILIYGGGTNQPYEEGELANIFFKHYEEIKKKRKTENIGWMMINEKFPEASIEKYLNQSQLNALKTIDFLYPQY